MQRGAEPAAGAAAGHISSAYRPGHRSVGRRRAASGVGLSRDGAAPQGSLSTGERPQGHALRTAAAAVDHSCPQAAPEELAYNDTPQGTWQVIAWIAWPQEPARSHVASGVRGP